MDKWLVSIKINWQWITDKLHLYLRDMMPTRSSPSALHIGFVCLKQVRQVISAIVRGSDRPHWPLLTAACFRRKQHVPTFPTFLSFRSHFYCFITCTWFLLFTFTTQLFETRVLSLSANKFPNKYILVPTFPKNYKILKYIIPLTHHHPFQLTLFIDPPYLCFPMIHQTF